MFIHHVRYESRYSVAGYVMTNEAEEDCGGESGGNRSAGEEEKVKVEEEVAGWRELWENRSVIIIIIIMIIIPDLFIVDWPGSYIG